MAAPAFGRSATATATAFAATLTATLTINAGETGIAIISSDQSSTTRGFASVTGIANAGKWRLLFSLTTGQSTLADKLEVWVTEPGAALAASSVVISLSGAADSCGAIVAAYTGVVAFGAIATVTSLNSSTGTISLTTRDVDSRVIACFTHSFGNTATQHVGGSPGTLRTVVANPSTLGADNCSALSDNTATPAYSVVQNVIDFASGVAYCGVALELRSTPVPASDGPTTGGLIVPAQQRRRAA